MKFVDEIMKLRDVKQGNKELALFIIDDHEVSLHLGNPSICVSLGEVEGELVSVGPNLEAAIDNMWILLREKQSPS